MGLFSVIHELEDSLKLTDSNSARAAVHRANLRGLYAVRGTTLTLPPASFSGCDIRAGIFVPRGKSSNNDEFKEFAELQTLALSSHRGTSPVRCLGEHWAREYSRGSRTHAGTLVFSVLQNDVFQDLLSLGQHESYTPFTTVSDQIPPFTITVSAVNELGQEAAMVIYGVVLLDTGMTLSIDDIFTESSYSFVAKWASPFVDTKVQSLVDRMTRLPNESSQALSSYRPQRSIRK